MEYKDDQSTPSHNGQRCPGNRIGTYCEHSLHASIKRLMEPDSKKHEIAYKGFIADIINECGIIEIQTKSFERLTKKLEIFLEGDFVTLVFPAVRTKHIVWIDPQTSETTKPRRSPKTGSVQAALPELYKIRSFLTHPRLRVLIIPVDVVEHRLLIGWSKDRKRGSVRNESFPLAFDTPVVLSGFEGYRSLIPTALPSPFTAKQFSKEAGLSSRKAWYALQTLMHVSCLEQVGKRGNALLYSVKKPEK